MAMHSWKAIQWEWTALSSDIMYNQSMDRVVENETRLTLLTKTQEESSLVARANRLHMTTLTVVPCTIYYPNCVSKFSFLFMTWISKTIL